MIDLEMQDWDSNHHQLRIYVKQKIIGKHLYECSCVKLSCPNVLMNVEL